MRKLELELDRVDAAYTQSKITQSRRWLEFALTDVDGDGDDADPRRRRKKF